jgi:predicted exporter
VFAAADFRPEAFAPFTQALAAEAPAPLGYDELAQSQLAGLVRSFRVPLREGTAFITFLERVRDPDAFGARMGALPGVRFVDQQRELARGHALYQERTLKLVLLGIAGVFALLLARYRRLAPTVAAFAPAALAAAVTLAVLGLWGRPLDLVGMSALLMVVSMGVDYGVFLVDASHSEEERRIALLSVFMAASTTVLGFGMLALSRHPMLSMIGVTATVGMLASLVLAPTTLVLVGHGRAAEKKP